MENETGVRFTGERLFGIIRMKEVLQGGILVWERTKLKSGIS